MSIAGSIGAAIGGLLGSGCDSDQEYNRQLVEMNRMRHEYSRRMFNAYQSMECMATGMFCLSSAVDISEMSSRYNFGYKETPSEEQIQSEAKATQLLGDFVLSGQGNVYEKTKRVIACPGKHFWIIGNLTKSYHKDHPFSGKPEVYRLDNLKKLHVTSFCVAQKGSDPTPYTDKVIAFAMHLIEDEGAFIKTINRIRESTLKEIPECAVWDMNTVQKMRKI